MDREIELKLECEPDALDRLRHAPELTRLTQGEVNSQRLRSVYFDTDDFTLMKSGIVLRVRETADGRIQTVKTQNTDGGPASNRGEWEALLAPGDDGPDLGRLPEGLKSEILALLDGEEIAPQFLSDVDRAVSLLRLPDGSEIELAIDSGILQVNRREARVSEIELELKHGEPAPLYRIALELCEVAPLRVGLRSKSERAYALATGEFPQAVRAQPIEFARDVSVSEAQVVILRECLAHFLANEPAVLEGHSTEGLHQMRVALRRMRSAFATFAPLEEGGVNGELAREAKWLTTAIGDARDHDVLLKDILAPVLEEAGPDEDLSALRQVAEVARSDAWEVASAAIRSPRMTIFVLRLALALDEMAEREKAAGTLGAKRVEEFAEGTLTVRWKKVRKLARNVKRIDTDEMHELRKRLKKLRYTFSFFVALYPRGVSARYLRRLTRLQDRFGALNDIEIARGILDALVPAYPELAQAGERVLEHHENRARKGRRALRRLCRKLTGQEPVWR